MANLIDSMANLKTAVTVHIPYETAVALLRATTDSVAATDLRTAGLAVLEAVQAQSSNRTVRQDVQPRAPYYDQHHKATDQDQEIFTVQVLSLLGRRTNLKVNRQTTVLKLKSLLQDQEGIPPDQMRFIFGGKQLPDVLSMQELEIGPGSVIHVVLRCRGS
ncbi:hypothetical protein TI39_contig262g00008 [Zymoseptoria brevis]|uniref:Ubiquitin-like domain-containing protein n=1 Tax=Zymoseptoria brevis TaxID=1047168 RepID=A0A0F4GXB3_9PEZI|nr:hypothetical protein TI39_contig262g00008 [Zymoseptoria brevis]